METEVSEVCSYVFTPHAQREQGKVIGRGVHIYIYSIYIRLITRRVSVEYVYVIARAGVIFGIYFSRVVGIAAVKSHEAKPSVISPLYRKRVEYIPEFHDCPCYNILIPWLQRGSYITFSRW